MVGERWCGSCGERLGPGGGFCGACGMPTTPGAEGSPAGPTPPAVTTASSAPVTMGAAPVGGPGPSPPPPADGGGSPTPGARGAGRWRWALVGAVAVLAVLAGALVAVVASRDTAAREDEVATVEVVLEPADQVTEEPFTESVVSEGVVPAELQAFSTVEGPGARPSASSDVVTSQVAGDRSGLYGSTAEGAVCDADALAVRIFADEEVNRVWSGVMGVDPGDSAALITALTPVVLGRDTAVTNHGLGPDGAAPHQSVLQAGTPVMVDANGTPRTQCGCGSPLLAPDAAGGRVDLVGDVWEGFDPRQVTEVRPSDEPLTEIETVDIESREPVTVPVGGEPDTVELDGHPRRPFDRRRG